MDKKPVSDCSDTGFFLIYTESAKELRDNGYDKYFQPNLKYISNLNVF
jgi:hypothetical protein